MGKSIQKNPSLKGCFFRIIFRSNINPDQPLRPKPPGSGVFKVTPAPNQGPSSNPNQYGVNNPQYFSSELNNNPNDGYGPNDFIVETVKLDKAFFHQFFTSKPLLLANGEVKQNYILNEKKPLNNLIKKKQI